MTKLTEDEVRALLAAEVDAAGGQRAWAKLSNLSAPYINDVLHGRRAPADNICRVLGIERTTVYTTTYKLKHKKAKAKRKK